MLDSSGRGGGDCRIVMTHIAVGFFFDNIAVGMDLPVISSLKFRVKKSFQYSVLHIRREGNRNGIPVLQVTKPFE